MEALKEYSNISVDPRALKLPICDKLKRQLIRFMFRIVRASGKHFQLSSICFVNYDYCMAFTIGRIYMVSRSNSHQGWYRRYTTVAHISPLKFKRNAIDVDAKCFQICGDILISSSHLIFYL